jgi:TolB-like protein/DNA-binding winged helix-turn-helix (wHTH) protein
VPTSTHENSALAETDAPVIPTFEVYRVNDLLIDTRVRRVLREGLELDLPSLSFDLLVALLRAAPGLVSSELLMESVWPNVVVGPETLTQRVKLLRQALGDNAQRPRYILGERGHGYRLACPAEPQPILPTVRSSAVTPGRRSVPLLVGLSAVALLTAAASAWWLRSRTESPARSGGAPAASAASARESIAVMPFANLTGDPAKEYLGDGFAEELIDALGRVPGLKVPARTSTFAYKGHATDIRRVARDLGVATILEGSVRSTADRIRVNARLVDANSGFEIWSQSYDRQQSDLFRLEDDLATEIVQALRGYLKVGLATPTPREAPSEDSQAYQLELQARSIGRGTPESERRALELIDRALARDPNFARALADRANINAASVALGYLPTTDLKVAEKDARRALELRPGLEDAYLALGWIAALQMQWSAYEESFRRALTINPDDPFLRNVYAGVLRYTGQLLRARAELDRSYRLAPADGFTLHELALTSSLMGFDGDALRFAGLLHDISGAPPNPELLRVQARAAARAGRVDVAAQLAESSLPQGTGAGGARQAVHTAFLALGDLRLRPRALAQLQRVMPQLIGAGVDSRTHMFFIEVVVMVGGLDEAYALTRELLARADQPYGVTDWSDIWMPEMRDFRRDPRFQQLAEALGLIDFASRYGAPDGCTLEANRLKCQ